MKLAQANAICNVTRLARDILDKDSPIVDALWAATELLDEAQEAFKEPGEQQSKDPIQWEW